MKYKKTSSFLVSMFMLLSMTVFVMASGGIGGVFTDDTSVIYGSSSADLSSATVMQAYLETFGPLSLNTTIISGELAPIKTSSQPLYLNDMMRDTKSTFTDNELPTVLESGEVNDYDYDLKIEVPNTNVVYDTTADDKDTPVINANFDNDGSYNLKIIFPVAVDVEDLEGESIVLFGKKYQFSDDEDDLSEKELLLFEDREAMYLFEGVTEVVNGKSIDVLVKNEDSVRLTIDGESKTVSEDWSGNIGGIDITVKDVTYQDFAEGRRAVDLYIDSQKLILSHTDEVELGDESIEGTKVEIKNQSLDKIREIIITITPEQFDDEIEYLELGDSFIDPVFGTVKFSLDNIEPELKSDERDFIEIKTSGDDSAKIEFTNKAGGEYNFEFIDDNVETFSTENIKEDEYFITGNNEYTQIWKVENIGVDSTTTEIRLRDMAKDSDYIEVKLDKGSNGEFTLADGSVATISDVTKTTINVSEIADYLYTENGAMITFDFGIEETGTWVTECQDYSENSPVLETCELIEPFPYLLYNAIEVDPEEAPSFTIPLWDINEDSEIDDMDITLLGELCDVINAEEVTCELIIPDTYVSCEYYPEGTEDPSSCEKVFYGDTSIDVAKIIISEETDYNGGTFTNNDGNDLGSEITISIENLNDSEEDIKLKLEGSGFTDDDDNKYLLTSYGTYVKESDGDKVEVYYPEEAMEISFNIGEIESKVTTVSESENYIVAKLTDNTASTSSDKNIIVVGGPCINTIAAQLLGGKTCGSEFTTATNVGSGQALIQVFTNPIPYNSGGKAILVAGYEAADTTRGVNYLKVNQIDLTIGTKIII